MARKVRLQFPGALYHVINRGNYRRDVFGTVGAAKAFVTVLGDACGRYDWRVHAYVVMPNHYHLALETPAGNLVEGMHWLQGTFATRFNRFRSERGHLFQGRYHAPLLEDSAVLARVVHYIHLNPVRARLVPTTDVARFRWSSLVGLIGEPRSPWLIADALLPALSLPDTPAGWLNYVAFLITLADDECAQREQGFGTLCRGWAVGSLSWRRALAREHSHLALAPGFEEAELRDIKEARYRRELERLLLTRGINIDALATNTVPTERKIELAAELRQHTAAPYRWIADALNVAQPESLRMQVHRHLLQVSP